jgi:hypothetical protein
MNHHCPWKESHDEREGCEGVNSHLLTPKFWLLSGGTAREDSRPTKSHQIKVNQTSKTPMNSQKSK